MLKNSLAVVTPHFLFLVFFAAIASPEQFICIRPGFDFADVLFPSLSSLLLSH